MENNAWERVKGALGSRLASEAFQNWFARTSYLGLEQGSLRVGVPDEMTKLWLESEYANKIQLVLNELGLPVTSVCYELSNGNGKAIGREPAAAEEAPREMVFAPASAQLNPRLTFDAFVVGPCNQFAHAAAQAVANGPGRSYNPLLIYGGTGMGKTHLMHAIGTYLLQNHGGMRVVYTSGERFMNEMINSIRTDRMAQFHAHYRTADVLLIDDIHTLANKERTQEEFFHTFNELYDHQKQIVLSSDSLPKNVPGLVERLRSRFEWGLMVDVQPPDLETKMAILDMKAESEGLRLPEEVRIFIASKSKSSVRELEGALIKLLAYSSVTKAPITIAMAQQVLKPLLPNGERRITIDSIMRAVADKFSLQPAQLKQKSNTHEIAYPRQIAMYVAKELTSSSLPEIGRAFGGKHHTTVLHSIRKVEAQRQADPDLNRMIHNLIDSFN
jgi:chromosomal replication initiator protein